MHKIGIIGLGNFGINFFNAAKLSKKAKLLSVCDIDKKKINMIRQNQDVSANMYTTENIEDFINSGIDTAVVAVPAYLNFEITEKLLIEDINVLASIPLSNDINKARKLINLERKCKSKFMACHILEYFSPYSQLKNILKRGKIGKASFARTSLGGGYPKSWNNWLDEDELGGGVINNLGINHFYYHVCLFGKVKRVFARRTRYFKDDNKKDYSLILMRFNNGSIVHSELSWAYPDEYKYISKLDVFGTNGQICYDELERGPVIFFNDKFYLKSYDLYSHDRPLAGNPYKYALEDFIKYMDDLIEQPVKTADSIYALEIAHASTNSAKKNKVINLT